MVERDLMGGAVKIPGGSLGYISKRLETLWKKNMYRWAYNCLTRYLNDIKNKIINRSISDNLNLSIFNFFFSILNRFIIIIMKY